MSRRVRWYERPWPKASVGPYSILASVGYLCAALFALLAAVTTSTGIAGRVLWCAVALVFLALGGTLIATLVRRRNL
jgi:VIT1/CCC1 family predicted Fe2+/Mn2+ transporter